MIRRRKAGAKPSNTSGKPKPTPIKTEDEVTESSRDEQDGSNDIPAKQAKVEQPPNNTSAQPPVIYERLSVETVRLFGEMCGITKQSVQVRAWKLLTEDLNYRLRHLISTSTVLMRHEGKLTAKLTTEHVNVVAKQLFGKRFYGHESQESPKLHFNAELKVFAVNEGRVDLEALALSQLFQCRQSSQHPGVGTSALLQRLVHDSGSDNKANSICDFETMLLGKCRDYLTAAAEKLPHELQNNALNNGRKLSSNFTQQMTTSLVHQLKKKPSEHFLVRCLRLILCLEPLLVAADCSWSGAIADWLTMRSDEDDLSVDTAVLIGRTLNRLARRSNIHGEADSHRSVDVCAQILNNVKLSHWTHVIVLTALAQFDKDILLQNWDFVASLRRHLDANACVFEMDCYFEYGGYERSVDKQNFQREETTRAALRGIYVASWKVVIEKLLAALSELFQVEQAEETTSVAWNSRSYGSDSLAELYQLAASIFNHVRLRPLHFQRAPTETTHTEASSSSVPSVMSFPSADGGGATHLRQLRRSSRQGDKSRLATAMLTPMTADVEKLCDPTISPANSVIISYSGTPIKKRKKQMKDWFDLSRKKRADIIFEFVATNAHSRPPIQRKVSSFPSVSTDLLAVYRWLNSKLPNRSLKTEQRVPKKRQLTTYHGEMALDFYDLIL